MQNDLIVAVATPAGVGGVGIVRASGAEMARLLPMLSEAAAPPPRLATRCRFLDGGGEVIDDGLALYFPAPASFTGEDVLELHAHGGAFVLQRLMGRALELGARLAAPGEFTLRAYLNGKLDLAQAEALADLIGAGSEAAAKAAARSLTGEFSARVAALTAALRALRVAVESDLDFSDEDAHTPDAATAADDIAALEGDLAALLEATRRGVRLASGADVVIVGVPNVGKSSLLNALVGEDAAIVSNLPGTTRDLIERQMVIDGLVLRLTDTAGLHDTDEGIEQEGIERALRRACDADVLLWVDEQTAATDDEVLDVVQAAKQRGAVVMRVRNKIDLIGAPAGEKEGVYHLSAKTGAGLDGLKSALAAAVGHAPDASAFSARARHVAALEAAARHLRQARGAPPELAAAWLRDVDLQLQLIVGHYDEEDLLGDIFSSFCIGK